MPVTISGDGTIYGLNQLPNRNLLHNGAMQVAQRGVSSAGITTSGYYTADRWRADMTVLGTWTQSVENDAPTGSGFRKSLKMLCTTAQASPVAGAYNQIRHPLEGQDLQRIAKGTASAQSLALSFWVKANTTGTYVADLYDGDNARSVSATYTISASATWERKTITFPADTTGAFDNDNGLSLYAIFWLAAGSSFTSGTLNTTWAAAPDANRAVGQTNLAAATNNYWQVTGIQLEVGTVATPYEFKSYADDLRQCQRYFYMHAKGSGSIGAGGYTSANQIHVYVQFPTEMRISPAIVQATGTGYFSAQRALSAGVNYDNFDSLTAGWLSNHGMLLYNGATVVGGPTGAYASVYIGNAAAYLGFSADL